MSVVLTTLPDGQSAEALVRTLVEERLVACGNVIPGVVSIFRWEGAIEREGEVLVVLKTATAAIRPLFARVAELHPYSVPEVVELPVGETARSYRDWVIECSKVNA